MSSTESSGAPAEATATTPAPEAAFPSFGTSRGSGLARGKRPAPARAADTAAKPDYQPTAIEVVSAPREYQNPFAPAETPVAAEPAPAVVETAPTAPVAAVETSPAAPVVEAPAASTVEAPPAPAQETEQKDESPSGLNILEPLQQKSTTQTWESEGFRPARESRGERPRREERAEASAEPVDISSIPPQFLYVRPGHTYVPTPSNYGGAPRERTPRADRGENTSAPAAARSESPKPVRHTPASESAKPAAKSSGGFFGWLKSLFGGSEETQSAAPARSSNPSERPQGHQRSGGNRSGRGGEGGGQRRRHRGGRNRGNRHSEGSQQGGV